MFRARFPIPNALFVDEVTYRYLVCKQFLVLVEDDVVLRKEQWVPPRAGESGQRCDIVIGSEDHLRDWIELKIWKPDKADSFNRNQVLNDLRKLRSRVDAGLFQVETYSDRRVVVPKGFSRHVLVLRTSSEPLGAEDWSLPTEGAFEAPVLVLSERLGADWLYLAVYDASPA